VGRGDLRQSADSGADLKKSGATAGIDWVGDALCVEVVMNGRTERKDDERCAQGVYLYVF